MDTLFSPFINALHAFPAKILSYGSNLSFPSLLSALLIAALFIVFRRGLRKRTSFRALLHALFPKSIWHSPSTNLDMKYVLANLFLYVAIVPIATINFLLVQEAVYSGFVLALGAPQNISLSEGMCVGIVTFAMFMAYEIAYWTDHYLSHKIPFLWEFHKVHHSATALTPFTNWRIHPVDGILFFNFIAFFSAIAHAVTNYALNKEYTPFSIAGSNIILLAYFYLYGHLQHSQLWISFRGVTGRIFMSPAHHQIHHSNASVHYDKNFGGSLALFDWLFGTLHMPSAKPERLTFGVDNDHHLQGFVTSTFYPFYFAGRHIGRACKRIFKKTRPPYSPPKPDILNPVPAITATRIIRDRGEYERLS